MAPSVRAADTTTTTEPSAREENEDATEINRQLATPVSDLWAIAFEQNNDDLQTMPGQGTARGPVYAYSSGQLPTEVGCSGAVYPCHPEADLGRSF